MSIFSKPFAIAAAYYLYNNVITHLPSYTIRHWYLRSILRIRIGRHSAIHMHCFFSNRHVTIGHNTIINRHCYLDGRFGIFIGNNVSISPYCALLSLSHDVNDPHFGAIGKKTVINDNVWIGMRAMILPGVLMGKGSVAGAGAVVTKNVEPYTIVAGVPAKAVGSRAQPLDYTLRYEPYFDTDIVKQ